MKSAVLLIGFNRPTFTRRIIESLKQSKPPRLYFFVDGPHNSATSSKRDVELVRKEVEQITWDCSVKTLFQQTNLGLKYSVPAAMDWFLGQESEGIVLEDDCVPAPTFFDYCDALLEEYRGSTEVGSLSGFNLFAGKVPSPSRITFTRYSSVWGWATWSRSWDGYTPEITSQTWETIDRMANELESGSRKFKDHWESLLRQVEENKIATWDFQWMLHSFRHSRLHVYNSENLIRNVGFGEFATNTKRRPWGLRHPPLGRFLHQESYPSHAVGVDLYLERLQTRLGFGALGKRAKLTNAIGLELRHWSQTKRLQS